MEWIFCAAGNQRFMDIAVLHGFKPGAQLPDTIYHAPYFVDQDFDNPNFNRYMAALEQYRPFMATVIDWDERRTFEEVIYWAESAARFVQDTIIIIPKIPGTIAQIPPMIGGKKVRLGYSIPTTHGGTPVPTWEFNRRPVHLLGGSPQAQIVNRNYLNVLSADGNMTMKLANKRAQFFANGAAHPARHRHFPQLQEVGLKDIPIDRNYMAFELSCINIIAAGRGMSCYIRFAVLPDLPQIKAIARQYDKELGFVMDVSLKAAIERRELYVAAYGQEIVGFCHWYKRRDGVRVIYEIAVKKNRRREKIGAGLLGAVPSPLRLKCTVDNAAANAFYEGQGLQLKAVESGRKRPLNVWVRD